MEPRPELVQISDREYVLRILDPLEGRRNAYKAKAIARLLGGVSVSG
jgi:hypothetical protein